jgi:oligopeptide/dipeptide ABC transporter ATP-binding protein
VTDSLQHVASSAPTLLSVQNLRKEYRIRSSSLGLRRSTATVVDGVDFDIKVGEAWGLVGESGSGKSTTARLVLQLIESSAGSVVFDGVDLTTVRGKRLRTMRAAMQAVFQDISGSMDAKMTIAQIVEEPLRYHRSMSRMDRRETAGDLLEQVGLSRNHLDRFPHELSGGQRQRVALARAISVDPKLLVLDEAVSALDVSTRAQAINLLAELRRSLGVAYLFIAHDLSVVHHLCDRIGVMYLGKIVESGDADGVSLRPRHPYTQALLSAVPTTANLQRERILLRGDTPSSTNIPSGCRFHTRCPYAFEPCATVVPPVLKFPDGGTVACHLHTQGPTLEGASVQTLAQSD